MTLETSITLQKGKGLQSISVLKVSYVIFNFDLYFLQCTKIRVTLKKMLLAKNLEIPPPPRSYVQYSDSSIVHMWKQLLNQNAKDTQYNLLYEHKDV